MDLDQGLIQIRYEVFGESTKEIAETLNVSKTVVDYVVEERGLKRLPVAAAAQAWKDLEVVDDNIEGILDDVAARQKVLQTLKRATLNPRYIAIEAAILSKIQTAIQNINTQEPTAPARIKTLADTFRALQDNVGLSDKHTEQDQGGLRILIQNKVDSVNQKADTAVAIQVGDGGRALSESSTP